MIAPTIQRILLLSLVLLRTTTTFSLYSDAPRYAVPTVPAATHGAWISPRNALAFGLLGTVGVCIAIYMKRAAQEHQDSSSLFAAALDGRIFDVEELLEQAARQQKPQPVPKPS